MAVDKTYNGKEALTRILANSNRDTCRNHEPYKVILLDYRMPIMDGVEVAREVRKLQLNQKVPSDTRLVLITGDEELTANKETMRLFDNILVKPIERDKLMELFSKKLKVLI